MIHQLSIIHYKIVTDSEVMSHAKNEKFTLVTSPILKQRCLCSSAKFECISCLIFIVNSGTGYLRANCLNHLSINKINEDINLYNYTWVMIKTCVRSGGVPMTNIMNYSLKVSSSSGHIIIFQTITLRKGIDSFISPALDWIIPLLFSTKVNKPLNKENKL